MYYELLSPAERRTPALLDFCSAKEGRSNEGVRRRLFDFFVLGRGTATFLDHSTVVARAQDGLSRELIMNADYLPVTYGPPVFSDRFAAATAADLDAELDFYPCAVRCRGEELPGFMVAKTLRCLPLVDPDRSEFRPSRTGTPLLHRPVYRTELADRFFIARDADHPTLLVCGQRLVDLVAAAGLRVSFTPAGAA